MKKYGKKSSDRINMGKSRTPKPPRCYEYTGRTMLNLLAKGGAVGQMYFDTREGRIYELEGIVLNSGLVAELYYPVFPKRSKSRHQLFPALHPMIHKRMSLTKVVLDGEISDVRPD